MCGHRLFNRLQAGKYKWEIKDGLNAIHTYTAEMIAPAPATVTLIRSGDFNSCNGVITVSAQGGVLPYSYYWSGRTETTSVLNSVCEQLITLSFYENGYGGCWQYFEVQTSPVGLQENTKNTLIISPNPVSDFLQIHLDYSLNATIKKAKILNTLGQLIMQIELDHKQTQIDLSHLPPGLYFIQVDNSKARRLVKQ